MMTVRIGIAMALITLGMAVIGISIFGLFRLRDALERLHAGAVTDTLGLLLVLSGLGVLCGFTAHTAKLALLVVILWATNPVSTHLIARMELITGHSLEPDQLTGEGEREL
ncbi:MAG: cation:proton antiporter [Lawsonibacter sp.]